MKLFTFNGVTFNPERIAYVLVDNTSMDVRFGTPYTGVGWKYPTKERAEQDKAEFISMWQEALDSK